jgi:hypothetical protein
MVFEDKDPGGYLRGNLVIEWCVGTAAVAHRLDVNQTNLRTLERRLVTSRSMRRYVKVRRAALAEAPQAAVTYPRVMGFRRNAAVSMYACALIVRE